MTTLIRVTGFEQGIASTSGGGLYGVFSAGCSIQGVTIRTGDYALKCVSAAGTASYVQLTTAQSTCIVERYYLYIHAQPSVDGTINDFDTSEGNNSYLILQTTGRLQIYDPGLTTYYNGPTLSADTWYRIDLKLDYTANTMYCQVNGASEFGGAVTHKTLLQNPYFGMANSRTCEIYFDDVVISQTVDDYPIGAGGVVGLRPDSDNAAGSSYGTNIMEISDGTDVNGTSVLASARLDEKPWITTANADYVRQTGSGTGNHCQIGFANTAETIIQGAMAYLQYASATATGNTGGCVIVDEDTTITTLWGVAGALADYSESSAFYKSKILPNPAGGWDATAVNALYCEFGYSDDANPDPYWLAIMLEVAYSSGTSGSVTAVVAEAPGAAVVPVVTGQQSNTVTAVVAASPSAAIVPTVTGSINGSVTAVVAASPSAAIVPTVTGIQNPTVIAVVATSPSAAIVPVVTGIQNGSIIAVVATCPVAAIIPVVTGGTLITAVVATSPAAMPVPTVTGG